MDYDPDLEARVVRLETAMESVQSNISEIKLDLRAFRKEVLNQFESQRKEHKADLFKIFGAGATMAISLAGLMAKGFGWF
jgi:hypothetical protein